MIGSHITLENNDLRKLLDRLSRRIQYHGLWDYSISNGDGRVIYYYREAIPLFYSQILSGMPLSAIMLCHIREIVEYVANADAPCDPENPYEILPAYPGTTDYITTRKKTRDVLKDDEIVTETVYNEEVTETHDSRGDYAMYTNSVTQNAAYRDALKRLYQYSPYYPSVEWLQGYPLQKFLQAANDLLDLCYIYSYKSNLSISSSSNIAGQITSKSWTSNHSTDSINAATAYHSTGYYDTYIGKTEEISDWPEATLEEENTYWAVYKKDSTSLSASLNLSREIKVSAYMKGYMYSEPPYLSWSYSQQETRTSQSVTITHGFSFDEQEKPYLTSQKLFLLIDEQYMYGNQGKSQSSSWTDRYAFNSSQTPVLLSSYTSEFTPYIPANRYRIIESNLNPDGSLQQPLTFSPPDFIPPPTTVPSAYFGGTQFMYGESYTPLHTSQSQRYFLNISPLALLLTFGNGW